MVLEDDADPNATVDYRSTVRDRLAEKVAELAPDWPEARALLPVLDQRVVENGTAAMSKVDYLDELSKFASDKEAAADGNTANAWYELTDFFELEKERLKRFKQPEVLTYMAALQEHVEEMGLVRATRWPTSWPRSTRN